jgi:hypothetical protein
MLATSDQFAKAMHGWNDVSDEDWNSICEETFDEYLSGRFLIEQLGAERHLDPRLMATIWRLRDMLMNESGKTAVELLLIDATIVSYFNFLRAQSWVGNSVLVFESELFGLPRLCKTSRNGEITNSAHTINDVMNNLNDKLLPLVERTNRLLIRNLKVLKDLRQEPTPSVSVKRADQVNVAERQINFTTSRSDDSDACR